MRDENKRDYFVGRPNKTEDEYGVVFNNGYISLTRYADLVSDRKGESDSIEKFGSAVDDVLYIVHDDNDGETPDVSIRDGVWLSNPAPASSLADYAVVGQAVLGSTATLPPEYIVDKIQGFRTKHIFVLIKAVGTNA